MTTKHAEVTHVKAYAFVIMFGGRVSHTDGVIASSLAEAEIALKAQYTHPCQQEMSFFNTGVAVMQPAMIERWEGTKRIEQEGSYAFLQGLFFGKYGERQVVAQCAKDKTSRGWMAHIYGDNHYVTPLA